MRITLKFSVAATFCIASAPALCAQAPDTAQRIAAKLGMEDRAVKAAYPINTGEIRWRRSSPRSARFAATS
jgi:hypothetical protein